MQRLEGIPSTETLPVLSAGSNRYNIGAAKSAELDKDTHIGDPCWSSSLKA